MNKLFLTILNMSLTASYVIIFVILVRLLLKKAPKVISYALWGVVAFRLIIPFSFESMFSLLPRNTNTGPIPHDIIYQQSPQINSGIEVVDSFVSESLPAPTIGASVNPLQIYIEIGEYIWIFGIMVLLIYSLVSVLVLKSQLKSTQLIEKDIFEAKNLKTPFVLGLIRPKIYLPVGINANERSYILLHEQTHIHRKDHIIKVLAFLILSIHWFNPLVWIAFMLMSTDMELSCDEQVLKEMNEDIKKPYANSLLSLATGRHILNGSPLAFGEGNVKRRIKNVLNYRKPSFWMIVVSIIAVIIVGIALVTNPIVNDLDLSSELLENAPSNNNLQGQDRIANEEKNTPLLLNKPVEDKVCLGLFITEQAYPESYYMLDEKAQKKLIPFINNLDKIEKPEGIFIGRYYLGINIVYRGLVWQVLSDGSLYHFSSDENGYKEYYAVSKELCEEVLQIAEQNLGIVPLNPKMIKNIKSAELTVAFFNNKEKVYKQTITDSSALATIEKLLSEAEVIHGGTGCPFTEGIMALMLEDGQQIKIAMATDSCCVYFANGMYFNYKPAEVRGKEDSGIFNNILFDYFDKIPITTRGEELQYLPQKTTLEPTAPELSLDQVIGVSMPELDYASDDIVIFHGYFGLFVYDLNTLQIIRSIDLKPLNCHQTQGSNACDVSVSVDGNTVHLHPMESEYMYIYTVSGHTLQEVPYQRMEKRFTSVPIEDVIDSTRLGIYSYNAARFDTGEYGYLHTSDWTLGTLSYVRGDMMFDLFDIKESVAQPTTNNTIQDQYREKGKDESMGNVDLISAFTEEEVAAARMVVEDYFRAIQGKDDDTILKTLTPMYNHPNVVLYGEETRTLISIDYNEDDPMRKSYVEYGRGKINRTKIEDTIVFKVSFNVKYPKGVSGSFNEGDYTNWSVILIREGKESSWLIDDQGY
jgi:beta-lactamase regulating signal transducer with metallopeptidase domain